MKPFNAQRFQLAVRASWFGLLQPPGVCGAVPGAVEEQEAAAAQGRRQLLAAAEGTAHTCCFPKDHSSPGWIKCSQQQRELLLTSSPAAAASLILPCPSCRERCWEHGRLCPQGTCHCLGHSSGLQPAPEGGISKKGRAVGQGSVLIR